MNKSATLGLIGLCLAVGIALLVIFFLRDTGNIDSRTVFDESKHHDYYTCAMHPDVHMHEPGQCPICGMTLTKIGATSHAGEESPRSTMAGRGIVALSPDKLQLIGVRFGKAELKPMGKDIRAYGRVAYDPDLYQVQEEYMAAVELLEMSDDVKLTASRERSRRLLKAAETRLKLLGLNDAQIQKLRERRQVDPQLLLGAEGSGKVWVYAEVYESDLSFVRVGLKVEAVATAYPGKTFTGTIQAIDALINPQTRTAKIRSEILDPEGELKPDLYVNVVIHSDLGEALSVPEGAVLNSGTEQHVFVHRGGGRFEPRLVKIGRQAEDRIEILEGIADGDEVVTSGNFLIDSESRLRAGVSSFYGGKEAAEKEGK